MPLYAVYNYIHYIQQFGSQKEERERASSKGQGALRALLSPSFLLILIHENFSDAKAAEKVIIHSRVYKTHARATFSLSSSFANNSNSLAGEKCVYMV